MKLILYLFLVAYFFMASAEFLAIQSFRGVIIGENVIIGRNVVIQGKQPFLTHPAVLFSALFFVFMVTFVSKKIVGGEKPLRKNS